MEQVMMSSQYARQIKTSQKILCKKDSCQILLALTNKQLKAALYHQHEN